eukprot:5047627-Amphidinium_carterae.1
MFLDVTLRVASRVKEYVDVKCKAKAAKKWFCCLRFGVLCFSPALSEVEVVHLKAVLCQHGCVPSHRNSLQDKFPKAPNREELNR